MYQIYMYLAFALIHLTNKGVRCTGRALDYWGEDRCDKL